MDSVYTYSNGEDSPDRWRFTARNIMDFHIAESPTALGDSFNAWQKYRPERIFEDLDPFRGNLLGPGAGCGIAGVDFADFTGPPAAVTSPPDYAVAFCADVRSPVRCDLTLEQLMAIPA